MNLSETLLFMLKLHGDSIKILITDDHLVIQQGLSFVIKDFLNKVIISYANSLHSTLATLRMEPVDLLILDINIPGGNNFQMIETIRILRPTIKILIFSAYGAETYALRYLKTGANGYLEKSASEEEIKKSVLSVLLKGKYLSAKVQDLLLEAHRPTASIQGLLGSLTNRELEIARLIVQGEGTSSIGLKLDLQVSTISTHKKNIFDKLKISNVSELITEFRLDLET